MEELQAEEQEIPIVMTDDKILNSSNDDYETGQRPKARAGMRCSHDSEKVESADGPLNDSRAS